MVLSDDDGNEDRCAEILADFKKGAGTFSLGDATEEDVAWAMENNCPDF
jgi:hypothetical protein